MNRIEVSAYDRVAGTISGQAFTALVTSVRYQHGKQLIYVNFDKSVNVISGFVRDHIVTTDTVPDLRVTARAS